jgi:dTDP-4-dehydrorhamnose 3,5-epimerase
MTQRFDVLATPLSDLHLLQRKVLGDARGYLQRLFCADELASVGWAQAVAQINHTLTVRKGSVRGLHLQLPPHAEMKLITCLRGEVWDVAVDLRAGSPTFLQWHGELLSADNFRSYLIPPGFAHGFQSMSDEAEMLYCHSQSYMPSSELNVNPFDTRIDIRWPLAVADMSEKDRHSAMLSKDFQGVEI